MSSLLGQTAIAICYVQVSVMLDALYNIVYVCDLLFRVSGVESISITTSTGLRWLAGLGLGGALWLVVLVGIFVSPSLFLLHTSLSLSRERERVLSFLLSLERSLYLSRESRETESSLAS